MDWQNGDPKKIKAAQHPLCYEDSNKNDEPDEPEEPDGKEKALREEHQSLVKVPSELSHQHDYKGVEKWIIAVGTEKRRQ